MEFQNLLHNKAGLVALVNRLVIGNLLSVRILRPQLLRLAGAVVFDDGIGRVENNLGRTVILLKLDHPDFRIIPLKVQNVLYVCTSPAVDALVDIAYNAKVVMFFRQKFGQQILYVVSVLVLVDKHVAEFFLVAPPHFFVLC